MKVIQKSFEPDSPCALSIRRSGPKGGMAQLTRCVSLSLGAPPQTRYYTSIRLMMATQTAARLAFQGE